MIYFYIVKTKSLYKSILSVYGAINKMFIFSDNEQLKKEFKKIVIDEGLTMAEIAKRCDLIPQQLNNRFNNSRVSFNDLKMFLDAMGYKMQIEFIKD